jgi:hypothetical protein
MLLLLIAALFGSVAARSEQLGGGVAGNWTSCAVTNEDDDTCQVPLLAAPPSEKCAVVRSCCGLGNGGTVLFNYYEMYYCNTPSGIRWFTGVLLFVWLIVVFSLLATTADNYFVVQLETLSAELRLSPTVAGITLLALGNSSPDVFADLAAVQNAGDFALALGELMGAAMFLTTIVLAAVIVTSTGGFCPPTPLMQLTNGSADSAREVESGGASPSSSSPDANSPVTPSENTAFRTSSTNGAPITSKTTVVMRNIKTMVLGTSSCDVDAVPFLRDVGVFFVALIAILLMVAIPDPDGGHSVTLLESIILILVYIAYVIFVVAASFVRVETLKTKLGCFKTKYSATSHDISQYILWRSTRSSSRFSPASSPRPSRRGHS